MAGLLALLAHPDDEFFCGGLLAAAAARGIPVHLVYWTRGEGGGSPLRRFIWRFFPRGWHPREREARRAAAALGAASVSFLGSVDPAPDPELRAPEEKGPEFSVRLAGMFSRHRPELVVTHGSDGDYGHPAHRRLHAWARELADGPAGFPLVSFNAVSPGAADLSFLNRSDPADFVLDTQPYFEKKLAIVRAHSSQRRVFEGLSPGGNLRELLRTIRYEGYHCWSEGEARRMALEKLARWTE